MCVWMYYLTRTRNIENKPDNGSNSESKSSAINSWNSCNQQNNWVHLALALQGIILTLTWGSQSENFFLWLSLCPNMIKGGKTSTNTEPPESPRSPPDSPYCGPKQERSQSGIEMMNSNIKNGELDENQMELMMNSNTKNGELDENQMEVMMNSNTKNGELVENQIMEVMMNSNTKNGELDENQMEVY